MRILKVNFDPNQNWMSSKRKTVRLVVVVGRNLESKNTPFYLVETEPACIRCGVVGIHVESHVM